MVKWYWLLYHIAMDKVGVSIAEMQRLLDIKQYRTAWLMGHKIRKAVADRDTRYSLAGLVEMDDSFFGRGPEARTRERAKEYWSLRCISLPRSSRGGTSWLRPHAGGGQCFCRNH